MASLTRLAKALGPREIGPKLTHRRLPQQRSIRPQSRALSYTKPQIQWNMQHVYRFKRQYSSNASEKKILSDEPPAPSPSTTDVHIPPVMTTFPKAMKAMQHAKKASSDIGDIEIGADGVVQPARKAPSVAANQFTARTSPKSQEEVLKHMMEINKKKLAEKDEKERAQAKHAPSPATSASIAKKPEVSVYSYTPRRWVAALNGVACLASFPLHFWGFYTLQAHLVAPVFAASVLWAWWHRRVMNQTLTSLRVNPGHQTVDLQSMNFFGQEVTRSVSIWSLATGLGRRDMTQKLSKEELESSLSTTNATTEVLYVDVIELLANAKTREEAEAITIDPDNVFRTRFAVESPPKATTLRMDWFLRFSSVRAADTQKQTRNMFKD